MSKKFAVLREGIKGIKPYVSRLLDEDFLIKAVLECIEEKDFKGIVEVVQAHLEAVNREKRAKSADSVCKNRKECQK